MPGESKYSPGVTVAKPKRSLIILLSILLSVATILALIFFATTLYFLLTDGNAQGVRDGASRSAAQRAAERANAAAWTARAKDVRLPTTVIPVYYDLRLQANIYGPDASLFNFNGSVRVRLECREATDVFYVHAYSDMTVKVDAIRLHGENDTVNLLSNVTYDPARQWYRLRTWTKLEPTKMYLLSFDDFGAPLTINLRGWYLSSYVENNVTKYLATSQLQPTDARRVFPCWDEPAFKSIFEIRIVRREDFHSLSNMPLVESRPLGNGWVEDSYKPTLNTSTYLLAFVVSQCQSLSGLDSRNRNFTIWARPDLISAAEYALDIGKKIIGFFEDYFELEYPLEKTDMLAVPHFAAGAMENWGLLIYREATLIWDPHSGTEFARQKVATVISHEIAHQWFGNLVTLDWWDDLWLNEGFATFVEYIGVAHAEPTWNMDEQFVVHQLQKVLFVDSLTTTHPVFLPVSHPDEINDIFDAISYNKGASILRMVEAFLGREVFRQGLKIYLSKHKFKNTKPNDLWDAFIEANSNSGRYVDVQAIMNVWIRQAGYPVVSVRRLGGNQFELTQNRFVLGVNPENASRNVDLGSLWSIPITYAVKSEDMNEAEDRIVWMNERNLVLQIDIPEGHWYALNLREAGFYRVNYDSENWRLLTEALHTNPAEIPRLMRAQLIDDSFHMANQGALSFEVFLNLTRYLRAEREYVPLNAAHRAFDYLYDMFVMRSSHTLLKTYVRSLISEAYEGIEWTADKPDNSHLINMARQIIVSMACSADHADCVTRSKTLFSEFMQDPISRKIPTSLSTTVYCTAIREGGVKEWDFLKALSTKVLHEDEKYRILEALGCTHDFMRLKTYVRELIDDAISKSDDLDLPASLGGNPIGLYVIYDTIKREWPSRNQSALSPFKMLLKAVEKRGIIIQTLPIQEELMRMNATLHEEADPQTGRWIHRIVTQSRRDQSWLIKYAETIHSWLRREVQSLQDQSAPLSS